METLAHSIGKKPLRHASLFTGVGGFDLAASWMGWQNVMQCEIDPFCQQVLRHHFPTSHLYGDIRTIDGNAWKGKIDILTGGFPCQPFSAAGRRRGTADDRFLWPEMLRVIREVQPTWVVAENVRGLLAQEGGLVFERVCSELEEAGYQVQPFIIPACAVGAAHRRERVWFVAHHVSIGSERRREAWHLARQSGEVEGEARQREWRGDAADNSDSTSSDTSGKGSLPTTQAGVHRGEEGAGTRHVESERHDCLAPHAAGQGLQNGGSSSLEAPGSVGEPQRRDGIRDASQQFHEDWLQAATRLCRVDDGIPRGLDDSTISRSRWRRESLKSYGNAIVPQVAHRIFQAIDHAQAA